MFSLSEEKLEVTRLKCTLRTENTDPKRFFILTDKGIKGMNGCKLRLVKYK